MPKRWPSYVEKQVIWNKLGYQPFPLQMPIHRSTARVLQIVGAEGGGKSFITAREMVGCVPWCNLIYLGGQEYDNCRREFEYVRDDLLALGLSDNSMVSDPKNPPWEIRTTTGCRITTISFTKDGAGALIAKGEQPDLIVLAEAGKVVSDSVFNAAWRRISRSNGRILLSGTLKDDYSWYAELEDALKMSDNDYQGETFSLPAWANLEIYPGGEQDKQIQLLKKTLPEDEWSRTVAARKMTSLAAIFGGVFDPIKHVKPCPFVKDLPVELWIDPGYFPSVYAIAVVQIHGDEVWQIDEIYENHLGHEQIIEMCKGKPWWAAVRKLVGDVAMKQHQADRSADEVWLEKTGMARVGQQVRIQDGISRHRSMLHQGRLYHDPKCVKTIWEYKMYRRRVDRDGNPISDDPVDEDNHIQKSLVYGLIHHFGLSDYKAPPRPRRRADPYKRMMMRT